MVYIILQKMKHWMIKILIKVIGIIIIFTSLYYLLCTRDGSIRLGLFISGYNPFINYENIDYENGNNYLNQIEIENNIIYLECKSKGIIKTARFYVFKKD